MRIRALLLLALMIGGAYVMIKSIDEYNEKTFADYIGSMEADFDTLLFNMPPMLSMPEKTWVVDNKKEVEALLTFLEDYKVKKIDPAEISIADDIDQFSVSLVDPSGKTVTIVVNENIIIQNSLLYYQIVDGPLDVDWLVRFFASNK